MYVRMGNGKYKRKILVYSAHPIQRAFSIGDGPGVPSVLSDGLVSAVQSFGDLEPIAPATPKAGAHAIPVR